MKKAFLFPGQGAQTSGMGKDFYDAFPIARQTFEEADDLLSFSLSKIMFSGSAEELTQTRYSQPALFVHSVALFRTLLQQIPSCIPDICSGLSLGEYTALFASQKLSFAETLSLVRKRADLMNQACRSTEGAMSAVLGPLFSEVEEAMRKASAGAWIANYNCPRQTVISGTKAGVEAASAILKEAGAKRVIPLQVDGAFHSPLMQPAQDGLAPFILAAPIASSPIRFVMNAPGDFVDDVESIKKNLTSQVTHSVRWEQGIQAMAKEGISFYLEIGAGTTLRGMNAKIVPDAKTLSLGKVADLDQIAGCLCS